MTHSSNNVEIRAVSHDDLPISFEHHRDLEAAEVAAFPSLDRETFIADWDAMLRDDTVLTRTILYRGEVAGHVISPVHDGRRVVAYWLGREFWRKGIATEGLRAFLSQVRSRPVYAHVVQHNPGSVRVLENAVFRSTRSSKRPRAMAAGRPDGCG